MQSDSNLPPVQPPEPPRPSVPGITEPANQPEVPQQLLGYDANGNPLYGTPTANEQLGSAFQNQTATPDSVTPIRTTEAPRLISSSPSGVRPKNNVDNVEKLHADSIAAHPELNLSEEEYILAEVYRHPIGFMVPLIGGIVLICLILTGIFSYPTIISGLGIQDDAPNAGIIALIGIILCAIVAGFTYMSVWIYRANRFFLTNESVIQEIQMSLFSRREQTVSLGNIEDASFIQSGIMQSMFDYGSIRLSTEGDETTYRMSYVSSPRKQVARLTNAVEDFKNGRRVDGR